MTLVQTRHSKVLMVISFSDSVSVCIVPKLKSTCGNSAGEVWMVWCFYFNTTQQITWRIRIVGRMLWTSASIVSMAWTLQTVGCSPYSTARSTTPPNAKLKPSVTMLVRTIDDTNAVVHYITHHPYQATALMHEL